MLDFLEIIKNFVFAQVTALELDNFFVVKFIAFLIILLFIFILLYSKTKKQETLYKMILDSSRDIIFVTDKKKIIDANSMFFTFMSKYDNLKSFNESHSCLGDFFLKEDGYLPKEISGKSWIDYMIKHPEIGNKIKMEIEGRVYLFVVHVSLFSKKKGLYTVTMADITQAQEEMMNLEKISVEDPLTRTGNRRYFDEIMEEETETSRRYKIPLSLIMYDIDFFKKVNDTHGHAVGDEVLIEYATLIKENLRDKDMLCRIGGEEFIIVMPYTAKQEASSLAERLRILVQDHKKILPITMSFGVTEFLRDDSVESILKRVDDGVYDAKEQGRNKVIVK